MDLTLLLLAALNLSSTPIRTLPSRRVRRDGSLLHTPTMRREYAPLHPSRALGRSATSRHTEHIFSWGESLNRIGAEQG
jgi:hypothetical protein